MAEEVNSRAGGAATAARRQPAAAYTALAKRIVVYRL